MFLFVCFDFLSFFRPPPFPTSERHLFCFCFSQTQGVAGGTQTSCNVQFKVNKNNIKSNTGKMIGFETQLRAARRQKQFFFFSFFEGHGYIYNAQQFGHDSKERKWAGRAGRALESEKEGKRSKHKTKFNWKLKITWNILLLGSHCHGNEEIHTKSASTVFNSVFFLCVLSRFLHFS